MLQTPANENPKPLLAVAHWHCALTVGVSMVSPLVVPALNVWAQINVQAVKHFISPLVKWQESTTFHSSLKYYLDKLIPSLPILDMAYAITGDQPILIVRVTHASNSRLVRLQSHQAFSVFLGLSHIGQCSSVLHVL